MVVLFRADRYTVTVIVKDFTLLVDTKETCDIVDITPEVKVRLEESGVASGTVTLFNVGSTAALTTVEFEPGLVQDLGDLFDRLAPPTRDYHHEKMWHDGNGFSHVRASLLKPGLTVPVVNRELRLGTWQQIVLINFDNRSRTRKVAMQVMGI